MFDDFLQELYVLSKECNFKKVLDKVYREEAIRDSLISGILSNDILQRLLQNQEPSLSNIVTQSRALELAQRSSDTYPSSNVWLPILGQGYPFGTNCPFIIANHFSV